MEDKLVFIDESGDPGRKGSPSSSELFVIAAVVVAKGSEGDLISLVRDAKARWGKQELKFSKLRHRQRQEVFEQLSRCDFSYYGIVVNKHLLYSPGLLYSHVFYRFVVGQLMKVLRQRHVRLEVHCDRFGNDSFQEGLKHYITDRFRIPSLFDPHAVVAENSETSELTQVADLIAGAIARATRAHGKHSDAQYLWKLSKQRALVEFWPYEKAREHVLPYNSDDLRLAEESERRMRLILRSARLSEAAVAAGEILLYGDEYVPCSSLVGELDLVGVLPSLDDDQKKRWAQRHCISRLRDEGRLIDSNSGPRNAGYSLIRSLSQARNFSDCQVKRAAAMIRRAESVKGACAIATDGRVLLDELPHESMLTFMQFIGRYQALGKAGS